MMFYFSSRKKLVSEIEVEEMVDASEFILEARELDADRIGAVKERDEVVGGFLGARLEGLGVGFSGIPNVGARHHRSV